MNKTTEVIVQYHKFEYLTDTGIELTGLKTITRKIEEFVTEHGGGWDTFFIFNFENAEYATAFKLKIL